MAKIDSYFQATSGRALEFEQNPQDETRTISSTSTSSSSGQQVERPKVPRLARSSHINHSQWWRSCWNGNQLDKKLLYQTVKAQQERRLALQTGPSCVYSVPRVARPQQRDEDPISDPLYASILGTSKQLRSELARGARAGARRERGAPSGQLERSVEQRAKASSPESGDRARRLDERQQEPVRADSAGQLRSEGDDLDGRPSEIRKLLHLNGADDQRPPAGPATATNELDQRSLAEPPDDNPPPPADTSQADTPPPAQANTEEERKEIVIESHALASANESPIRVKPLEGGQRDTCDQANGHRGHPTSADELSSREPLSDTAPRNHLVNFSNCHKAQVWHMKHFCCAECRVPLEGQQYITLDESLPSIRLKRISRKQQMEAPETDQQTSNISHHQPLKPPYCLKCFDQLFGETCEQCGKLITSDRGAINHEQRCWHASGACFKCHRCSQSLMGRTFLPSSDGRIYCSSLCSQSNTTKRASSAPGSQLLSVANYSDPKLRSGSPQATPEKTHLSAVSHLSASEHPTSGPLLRHKPLIDYLVTSASTDQTSRQLLNYLHNQFRLLKTDSNETPSEASEQQLELMAQIAPNNQQVTDNDSQSGQLSTTKGNQHQLTVQRNKLNPFLADQLTGGAHQGTPTNNDSSQLANYINIDNVYKSDLKTAKDQGDTLVKLAKPVAFKASQCSPAASLVSNEGTMSDQSASSSGVSTAPPVSSTNGSLKSHSPLSTSSSVSSGASIPVPNEQAPPTRNVGQRAPLGVNSAATLERRRRVQPVTELSVVDLMSVADEQLDLGTSQNQNDGFDQLVSQFPTARQANNTKHEERPKTGNRQQESFFFELAQRLPKMVPSLRPQGENSASPLLVRPIPLDTNGLPIVEPTPNPPSAPQAITDHYSTVNKGPNRQQQMANEGAKRDGRFFAITSPLMNCHTDTSGSQLGPSGLRPTSSLSVLAPVSLFPYGANSLTRANSHSQQLELAQQQQLINPKSSLKPAKSVSFDPSIKEPADDASGSMTLGRASLLKSALKANSWNPSELSSTSQNKLSAYSAHYDQYGRRVRLSALLPPMECDTQDGPSNSSKSLLSGALSKLTLGSSRGGRREERKLRQQQQQLAQRLVVQTQPTSDQSLFVMEPISSQLQMIQQQQQQQHLEFQQALDQQPMVPSISGLQQVHSASDASEGKRRRSRTRRHSGSRFSSSRRHHSRRSRRRAESRRRSRYCRESDCYDSDDSSQCSTCSSGSSDSDSNSSSASSYRSASSDRSYSSSSTYSRYVTSATDSDSYSSDSPSSSRSSSPCSSYSGSSRSCSPTSSDRASRPTSDITASSSGSHNSRHESRRWRRYSSSNNKRHRRHQRASHSSSRRGRASTSGKGRRSSRSSSRSSSSRRSSSRRNKSRRQETDTHRRRSHQPHQRFHRHRSGAHHHMPLNSVTGLESQQQQQTPASNELKPQVNFYAPPVAVSGGVPGNPVGHKMALRAGSPSPTASSEFKIASNENCRLI